MSQRTINNLRKAGNYGTPSGVTFGMLHRTLYLTMADSTNANVNETAFHYAQVTPSGNATIQEVINGWRNARWVLTGCHRRYFSGDSKARNTYHCQKVDKCRHEVQKLNEPAEERKAPSPVTRDLMTQTRPNN